jgi:ankyrin repeat protein
VSQALNVAAMNGDLEMVKYLINVVGISVNQRCLDSTPLLQACNHDHIEIVQYLLEIPELHMYTNTCEGGDENCGSAATSNNNLEMVKLLLKHDALIDYFDDPYMSNSDEETLAYYNKERRYTTSAVTNAIESGYFDIAECLIEHGAKVGVTGRNDEKPLGAAIESGNCDLVR